MIDLNYSPSQNSINPFWNSIFGIQFNTLLFLTEIYTNCYGFHFLYHSEWGWKFEIHICTSITLKFFRWSTLLFLEYNAMILSTNKINIKQKKIRRFCRVRIVQTIVLKISEMWYFFFSWILDSAVVGV